MDALLLVGACPWPSDLAALPQMTGETWFPASTSGATALGRVVGHRPAYAAALQDVDAALWSQDQVEPELLELCRLRIAQLLEAGDEAMVRTPAAADLDDALVDALRLWPTSPLFTERHRAGLDYAEQLLIDAQGVSDEQAARVIDVFGEGGFLVLTYGCGYFETIQRAQLLLARRDA
jgi:alkylhydroperoxidase family enzyme